MCCPTCRLDVSFQTLITMSLETASLNVDFKIIFVTLVNRRGIISAHFCALRSRMINGSKSHPKCHGRGTDKVNRDLDFSLLRIYQFSAWKNVSH